MEMNAHFHDIQFLKGSVQEFYDNLIYFLDE